MIKTVAMIGVGKLGQDCAEVMAEHYEVTGYDVAPRTPSNFKMAATIQEAVTGKDMIFIAAPTPHDSIYGGETPSSHLPNKDFDYGIVTGILNEVNKYVNQDQLVVLISTVLPGTVRHQLRPCITNARFIYNPYLIAMGTIKWDMVNPEMVIIGTEDGDVTTDAKILTDFYNVFMQNNPRYEVGTWDEAESIKIFYNTFISTKIALVNMIQDVAETNGNINVDVVTTALAKSDYRITGPAYMVAGMGDAGACHPRDNIALRYLADRLGLEYDLFDAIMKAREVQAERMALECLRQGHDICILGKAYKPAVEYINGSYSLLVGHYIEQYGGTVTYHDPNTGDADQTPATAKVYLIGYWEKWVEDFNFPQGAVIIDPWRKLAAVPPGSPPAIHYGNTRPDRYRNSTAREEYLALSWPEYAAKRQSSCYVFAGPETVNAFMKKPEKFLVHEINTALRRGKVDVIFDNAREDLGRHELTRIHQLLPLLNITADHVYYVSGSHDGVAEYDALCSENGWTEKINLVGLNAFKQITAYQPNFNLGQIGEYQPALKAKKFLCKNRIDRLHRECVLALAVEKDLVKDAFYSYYAVNRPSTWVDELIADPSAMDLLEIKSRVIDGLAKVQSLLPLKLNLLGNGLNPNTIRLDDLEYYRNSYFSLVNETNFFQRQLGNDTNLSTMFLTEKTFAPLLFNHPMLVLSRPGTLVALHQLGFKTFSPYINEEYDSIVDDERRLLAVMAEVDRLCKFTDSEWLQWQLALKPIIDYNRQFSIDTKDQSILLTPSVMLH